MSSCSSCSDSNSTTAYIQQQLQARTNPLQDSATQAGNTNPATSSATSQATSPAGSVEANKAVQPTVNTQGEALGTLVNEAA